MQHGMPTHWEVGLHIRRSLTNGQWKAKVIYINLIQWITMLYQFKGYELPPIWSPPKVFGNGQNGRAALQPRQETGRQKGKLCHHNFPSYSALLMWQSYLALERHRGIFWPAREEHPVTRPHGWATDTSHFWTVSQPLGFHSGNCRKIFVLEQKCN